MNIISIDPAVSKKIAYAVFLEDRLDHYQLADSVEDVQEAMLLLPRLDLVVTEDMYNGPNFNVVKQLCYAVGEIRSLAKRFNLDCRLIPPVIWKKHHGILIKKSGTNRAAYKRAKDLEDRLQVAGSKMFILYTVDGSAKDFISISIMDPRKI